MERHCDKRLRKTNSGRYKFNVGRIIQYLKKINEYENTLIVFMSDNGSAGEDFYNNPIYGPYLKENFTVKYDDMGKENSFIS